MTGQRLTIAQSLERLDGFPTAQEVLADAVQYRPGISKATVYNALAAFAATGEIRQIGGKGERSRYAVADSGVTTTVMSRDGFVLDETQVADLPIERVQITYVVGIDVNPSAPAEEPTDSAEINLRTPVRTSRPTDPVYRVAS